jgi:Flp pilus assembly secretin CpaC
MPRARMIIPASLLAAALALAALPGPAHADETTNIDVVLNQAKVMHISRPADIVIIGNPAIADATIQDNQTLIITGHSFGTTNLIVLDSSGQPIASGMLTVKPGDDQVVTVYRRALRQTFSCTPDCSPVVAVGDTADAFNGVAAQIQQQNSISSGAAQPK